MKEKETKKIIFFWSLLTPSTKCPIKDSSWNVRKVFKMEMLNLQIKLEVSACICLNCFVQHRESNLPALFVHLVMNVLTDWNAAKCYFMLSLLLGVLWGHAGQHETEQCMVKSLGSWVKHKQVWVQPVTPFTFSKLLGLTTSVFFICKMEMIIISTLLVTVKIIFKKCMLSTYQTPWHMVGMQSMSL